MIDMKNLELAGLTPEEKLHILLMRGLVGCVNNQVKAIIGAPDDGMVSKMSLVEVLTSVFISSENYSKEQIEEAFKKCADTMLELIDKYSEKINYNLTALNK